MKKYTYILLIAIVGSVSLFYTSKSEKVSVEREVDFNFDWKFSLADDSASVKESSAGFNDAGWRTLHLPHDWSVEHSFDSVNGDGATAYLPGGTGWYRKRFDQDPDKNTYVVFDGVYNNSEVWINGTRLGVHPYGYSPFYFDITSYLNIDGKNNVLAVKVDRTRYIDSRWYPGSGIYRNVKLITTDKLHIPVWGTFITTPEVSEEQAVVVLDVTVQNNYSTGQDFDIRTEIYGPQKELVSSETNAFSLSKNSKNTYRQTFEVASPQRWDVADPKMYKAVTSVLSNSEVIDEYETSFGIRTIRFDRDKGFFLNGKNMKIKGVCLHHDGGLVGVAVPKGVWRRRLQKLKEGGCNAIRISHNPGSEEFLDLCDEMGFLVQDEFFDEWDYPKDKRLNSQERHSDYVSRGYSEHFQEHAESDLKNSMLAHRNHPSIFQWSIGNEIEWTYHPRYRNITGYFNMNWQGNYFWELPPISPEQIKKRYKESAAQEYELATTARKLSSWVREMDTTRYVTANCILPSASHITGYADALDVVGYSYRRILYDYGYQNYPDKPIMGTENLGQWHEWKSVMERDFISGIFIWTGIEYMGEAHGQWPEKATASGLLDLGGFEKGSYHMMKTLWVDEPHIHMATQTVERSINKIDPETGLLVARDPEEWETALWNWQEVNSHWNYSKGEIISVELYSNCEEIELFLNNKSLGTRKLAEFEDRIYKWGVPFVPGNLVAKGKFKGDPVSASLVSAGAPAAIELTLDKASLKADGYDVAHVVAQLVDDDGHPVKSKEREIAFKVRGDVKVLGVDNGSSKNVQDYQSDRIVTSQGRSLLIVQSGRKTGEAVIEATSADIKSNEVTLIVNGNALK
ncbi:glycoside hydrolase family 2 protein [Fulvivirga sp. M361]|uniref:sugar-binding domain-containing protein n=1 Tax=Fulvivirga sp. M361 TaxID=2594266 RepID=UPI00117B0E3F|nr:sugar-binding domain-containing protein [Fulvivirga sp. M361]TRX59970.1 glycoside hydrolase family 2 protein [Fulvivirga sp. M361]